MTITVGVYLGKKDRFLRNWYDILPRGQFPLLVKYCIQSYLKGVYFPLDTICDRESFKERMRLLKELSPTQRNVTFTPEDGPVYQWVDGVDNGYRSEEIKSILKDTIIHTLLDEFERTPLAFQHERRRYGGYWNGSHEGTPPYMYMRERDKKSPRYEGVWEGRENRLPSEGRESWVADRFPEEEKVSYPGLKREEPVLRRDPIEIEEMYRSEEVTQRSSADDHSLDGKKEAPYRGFHHWVDRLG
ncbi:hypothetical protein [Paludifilum halophilum]|uniref:Uncharacterized protein n=1 Tax=Paludifilum halophilum TaxID=1642702 RepID=A0A235B6M9_9BACL|nr:hypothetical protein [Paludifilum halophilum]OYD07953.1 hypothetical protein CHM34_07465 [Paludifilum halophilum]